MVAASIHLLAAAPHGVPTAVDWITASSQGVLMQAMDAIRDAGGSEDYETECGLLAASRGQLFFLRRHLPPEHLQVSRNAGVLRVLM